MANFNLIFSDVVLKDALFAWSRHQICHIIGGVMMVCFCFFAFYSSSDSVIILIKTEKLKKKFVVVNIILKESNGNVWNAVKIHPLGQICLFTFGSSIILIWSYIPVTNALTKLTGKSRNNLFCFISF